MVGKFRHGPQKVTENAAFLQLDWMLPKVCMTWGLQHVSFPIILMVSSLTLSRPTRMYANRNDVDQGRVQLLACLQHMTVEASCDWTQSKEAAVM